MVNLTILLHFLMKKMNNLATFQNILPLYHLFHFSNNFSDPCSCFFQGLNSQNAFILFNSSLQCRQQCGNQVFTCGSTLKDSTNAYIIYPNI